jgi:protein-S-isoprenylcysteine O-methyltransferase Ste14
MAEIHDHIHADHVELPFPPTLVFLSTMVLAAAFELAWPTSAGVSTPRLVLGGSLVVTAFAAIALALRAFWRRNVDPNPRAGVPVLLDSGIYRVSRNPIYAGWIGILLGLAVAFDSVWMLMLVPLLWLYLEYGVIAREEDFLEARFPETYGAYRRRVRRWL